MLKTKVKASSITNLTDARYFAAMGVEWLGFNLNSNDDAVIPIEDIQAIEEWVEGVNIVAEYGDEPWDRILEGVAQIVPGLVQIGGNYGVEEMMELPASVGVIKEIVIDANSEISALVEQMEEMEGHVQAFLLKFSGNGINWQNLEHGNPFSLQELDELMNRFPVILEMDLSPEDLVKCIAMENLGGLSVKGGEEEKVGFKSFDELDDFFDTLMD